MNIRIIRVFTRMREMLTNHKDLLSRLDSIEGKLLMQDSKLDGFEKDLQVIFQAIRDILNPKSIPLREIGFKQKGRAGAERDKG